jgi:sialic acid synthase SpsE
VEYELKIGEKLIGLKHPTYFIADIAANHDGDLERAKKLITLAKESGADAVKFQHFKAASIVSDFGFRSLGNKISHQSKWKKSVYDVYKDASINLDWTYKIKDVCESIGISFMTSPYDFEMVDHVNKYLDAYKIGSGDITWLEIIKYIASKDKPYILATGASNIDEVIMAVNSCLPINKKIALLQCNTNYTGSVENMNYINLNVLKLYRNLFPDVVLGLSDHTPGHSTVMGAISLGARVIEKHFTDDTNRVGPDHAFSMDPLSWSNMVKCSRELESALGMDIKKIEPNEQETVILQRRAIRVVRDLKIGEKISIEDLTFLRPCPADAIPPYNLDSILNKTIRVNISNGNYVKYSDFD